MTFSTMYTVKNKQYFVIFFSLIQLLYEKMLDLLPRVTKSSWVWLSSRCNFHWITSAGLSSMLLNYEENKAGSVTVEQRWDFVSLETVWGCRDRNSCSALLSWASCLSVGCSLGSDRTTLQLDFHTSFGRLGETCRLISPQSSGQIQPDKQAIRETWRKIHQ